jgi:hypothetical protein
MSKWPPSSVNDLEAWSFVVSELNCHRKEPRDTWIDTLNRLLRKSEFLGNAAGARIECKNIPILNASMLNATSEKWTLDQLMQARHWNPHQRDEPHCDQCPILVLELLSAMFVVDGGTRINRRIRDRDAGPHEVVRIKVADI